MLAIVALEVPLGINVVDRIRSDANAQALSQAQSTAAAANDSIEPPQLANLDELVKTNAATSKGRVMIFSAEGLTLADSSGPGRSGADYSTRPEVKAAISGDVVQIERHSSTVDRDMLATAVPVVHFGKTVGAVRITQGTAVITDSVNRAVVGLIAIGLLVLLLGSGAGWIIANQLSRPMRRLEKTAERVYLGDLNARAAIEGPREQRALAVALNNMLDRLIGMFNSQREFVADASHQLRTPLQSLRIQMDEIAYANKSPEVESEVAKANAAITRINSTIDQLLFLSRLRDRKVVATRVDLPQYAEAVVARWLPNAAAEGIDITVKGAPPWGRRYGMCSQEDLDRVIDALVENSVAYSNGKGPIEIGAVAGGIEITDRGPGLEVGEEERVFDRFARGSAGRDRPEGTGLGLAIAKEIMEIWNGSVELTNRTDGITGARALVLVSGGVRDDEDHDLRDDGELGDNVS
ncbi:MAG: HAMP domain-containing protein [Actinobacteria bacterium]|uniref:histidine kinase n=1 Tax=freshwater metagenome TaxID=449393 RepID=A0A6J7EIT7_9ZZZZ|nr:HAMP domain-containing protein [Actinomycetota bacterium]